MIRVWIVHCNCSPLFLTRISLWYALDFRVILDCTEFYPVKFLISVRLRFHSPAWQPVPVLWDLFFLMLCFPHPLHLLLIFLVCLMIVASQSFYYTLPKVWIWLFFINTLGSLWQQADPPSPFWANFASSYYVIVQAPHCSDGAPDVCSPDHQLSGYGTSSVECQIKDSNHFPSSHCCAFVNSSQKPLVFQCYEWHDAESCWVYCPPWVTGSAPKQLDR